MLVHKHKLTQKDKHKLRQSADWLKLKRRLIEEFGEIDFITGKPLIQGKMTCHHMDLNPANYANYSNEENFILLNEGTHRLLHQLYNYYEQDEKILEKLKQVMDRMLSINKQKE